MALESIHNTAYGLSQAIIDVNPPPIISKINPTVNSRGQIGQMWINKTLAIAFILARIANNQYTWMAVATVAASVTSASFVTAATFITAGTTIAAATTITAGTGLIVTAGGATITGNSTVTGTLTSTSTLTVNAGGAVITAGGLTITAGGADISGTTDINTATAAVTNIGRGGTGIVNIGNDAAALTLLGVDPTITLTDHAGAFSLQVLDDTAAPVFIVDSLGVITAATNIISLAGNITATNGDVIISTATKGITLPGPTRIINGAGVPAGALAVNVGDLYINTTAGTAITRLYICDAPGSWVTFTASA